jgi:phospholipid/cholesterol/gamma-HCH transport system substrate-binding protein
MFKGDRNFAVGLFMTVAIGVFVFFVIWLTGRTGQEEMSRYTLMFDRDVSGLSLGGAVNYMGVNIGSVTAMSLEQGDGTQVRVDIEILATTPVDSGTWASIAMQGITGVAVVNLASDPGTGHQPLKAPPGRKYPVIPVRDVGFAAIMSSMGSIMAKLDNLDTISSALADDREALAGLPAKLDLTLGEIRQTVVQVKGLATESRPELRAALENLGQASVNLAELTGRMNTLLSDNEAELNRFVAEGLAEAPALMEDARQMMRELEKLLRELQDDPSQLLYKADSNALEVER